MDDKRYLDLTKREIKERARLTPEEKTAVEALLAAVRALPKSLCLDVDEEDGFSVSKRITRGSCKQVACVRRKSLKF